MPGPDELERMAESAPADPAQERLAAALLGELEAPAGEPDAESWPDDRSIRNWRLTFSGTTRATWSTRAGGCGNREALKIA
jgi:hypothetical protein